MYDVLALVFAVPHLSWRFFDPAPLGGTGLMGGEAARLVGMSPKQTGIKRPEVLRQFVIDALLGGLKLSSKHADPSGVSPMVSPRTTFKKMNS